MGTKPMSVKLEAGEREALSRIAAAKNRSAHFVARAAITEYLTREEKRQSFIAEAEASLKHFQETGLHITLEEFSSWADDYQDNPEAPFPECHT